MMATNAKIMMPLAMGRFKGRRWGLRSSQGARSSAPKASPGMITVPMTTKSPEANGYFSNWYKNRKYQSGKGVYDLLVGSALSSNGAGCKMTNNIKPTRKTTATIHSFSKKSGMNASVFPG